MTFCEGSLCSFGKSRCESKEAKMCRRKNGVASWSDTACFLQSHGEVSCDRNQHGELGWVVCLFVSLKHLRIAGLVQNSFCKFEVALLQLLLLSAELNHNLLSVN